MRVNDFLNISEHIKEYVLKSSEDYIKLLGVIGNNHRYRFIDQLSIFDRRLSATACGKFDFWREQFDRTVMRGEKGIPILCDYGNFKRVEYVFDVSQTVSRNNELNEVNLWQFDRADDLGMLRELIEENGFEYSKDSILENIFTISRIYSDDKISSLSNELRIYDEDRNSFGKFVRDGQFRIQYVGRKGDTMTRYFYNGGFKRQKKSFLENDNLPRQNILAEPI